MCKDGTCPVTRGVLSSGSNGHLYHRKQITLCQAVCWDFFENTKKFNCFIAQDSRIVFCFVGFFFFCFNFLLFQVF